MLEILLFVPGCIILVIGLVYVSKLCKPPTGKPNLQIAAYFTLSLSSPFLTAYILESILFPERFLTFFVYFLFGFILTVLIGLVQGTNLCNQGEDT